MKKEKYINLTMFVLSLLMVTSIVLVFIFGPMFLFTYIGLFFISSCYAVCTAKCVDGEVLFKSEVEFRVVQDDNEYSDFYIERRENPESEWKPILRHNSKFTFILNNEKAAQAYINQELKRLNDESR